MESPVEQVVGKLKTAQSFYDVITVLYQELTVKNWPRKQTEYNKWLKTREKASELSKLVQAMASRPGPRFQAALDGIADLYIKNKKLGIPLMVHTLYCFDDVLSDLPEPRHRTLPLDHGPMNSPDSQARDEAYLYLAPGAAWQESFLAAHKLRRSRNLEVPAPSSLAHKLKSYTVVPKNQLGGLIPRVLAYYPSETDRSVLESGLLRIALFPFGNQEWFTRAPVEGGRAVNIEYSSQRNEEIFGVYSRALEEAERRGANIVVFPEMALGSTVLEALRSHLKITAWRRKHVKFIFAGTEWVCGENRACVLNAVGRPLVTQKKREAYELYSKELNGYQRENLTGDVQDLYFLDVPGLGRVSSVICRDLLDSREVQARGSALGSSLIVVSCYTPQLDGFQGEAQALSRKQGALVLVCNGCAPMEEVLKADSGAPVGFLSVPVCTAGKHTANLEVPYTVLDAACTSGPCPLCTCMRLYTLHIPETAPEAIAVELEKIPVRDLL